MTPLGILVRSVQHEFAEERAAVRNYPRGDPLMHRFFDAFLVEDVLATVRRLDALYNESGPAPDTAAPGGDETSDRWRQA